MKNTVISILFLVLSASVFSQSYQPSSSRKEELNKQYCTGLFSTPEGTYFDLENDNSTLSANSYINILDWLQGRVAGLQVYQNRNTRIPFIRNQPAAIFIDEMRVDAGMLNMIPVNDIALIKVMKTPFIGLWGAPGGAIAIYTTDGEDEE